MNRQIQLKNTLTKLERIKREIQNTIIYLESVNESEMAWGSRCKNCDWKNTRVRMDKSYFCRSCGFDSRKMEKKQ